MTKMKFCGLSRTCDIDAVNALKLEYVGFVFAPKSKRCVSPDRAAELKSLLADEIKAVGVFVNADPQYVAKLLNTGVIDIAQLHGSEDEEYIRHLRQLTDKPVIRAFRVKRQMILRRLKKARRIMCCWTPAQGQARYLTGNS